MRPHAFRCAPSLRKRQSDSLFRPTSAPSFEGKKGRLDEKHQLLWSTHFCIWEQRGILGAGSAQGSCAGKKWPAALDYIGVDIASIPDLFTNAHSDPTFEKAYRNLRLEALRKAYQTLSGDERKLLCLYYYHEFSMEKIGRLLGVTKMAISKRLRKILDHLRGLMEDEAPYFFANFSRNQVYKPSVRVL